MCLFLKKAFLRLGLSFKKIDISKGCKPVKFIAFLWHFTHVFPVAMPTKCVKKIVVFWIHRSYENNTKTPQKIPDKGTFGVNNKFHKLIVMDNVFGLADRPNDFGSWLYVLIMSRRRFRVNPHSIVAWMSRNSLLETGPKSEVWLNGWVFVYELSGCGFESRCSHFWIYTNIFDF